MLENVGISHERQTDHLETSVDGKKTKTCDEAHNFVGSVP
jgi:hypothetical protein